MVQDAYILNCRGLSAIPIHAKCREDEIPYIPNNMPFPCNLSPRHVAENNRLISRGHIFHYGISSIRR